MNNPNPMADTILNLRRSFNAPRPQVFRAWTEPRAIERWFKPMGMASTVSQLDLRAGGSYCIDLLGANGASASISGHYVEVTPPEKLAFTWRSAETDQVETLVTLEFVQRGSATEILLTHELLTTEEMIAMHRFGWLSMMDELSTVF
ncbi:MAG: SRPBCC domain-containing protein [Chloroflexota bacterium]